MKSGEVITIKTPFLSKTEIVLEGTDLSALYRYAVDKILEYMDVFQSVGSNWRCTIIVKLDVNTAIFKPLKGRSYIPLPPVLTSKKALINMKNKDNKCFKWCVVRILNSVVEHVERIPKNLQNQANDLEWGDIK